MTGAVREGGSVSATAESGSCTRHLVLVDGDELGDTRDTDGWPKFLQVSFSLFLYEKKLTVEPVNF